MVGTWVITRAAVGLSGTERFGVLFEAVLRDFDVFFIESLLEVEYLTANWVSKVILSSQIVQ
jgi:hypothetical protein